MKVIGFSGSPRKNGNSDLALSSFLAGAEAAGAETRKIYLTDLDLQGCQACYACQKSGVCKLDDDLSRIIRTLTDYDVWALATPVYCWMVSMPAKCLIDRLFCMCHGPNLARLKGKKFVLVTASADPVSEATPFIKGACKKFIAYLGMKWGGELLVEAHKKGEVKNQPTVLEKARKLGGKLAQAKAGKPAK